MAKRHLFIYLVVFLVFLGSCKVTKSEPEEQTPESGEDQPITSELIQPGDLQYLGAFRLPDSGSADIVRSWNWGGNAMTYRPGGDASGGDDGFPGSLFATGHAWQHQVSEISIPIPVISSNQNVNELNTATTIQSFQDIYNLGSWEMPRVGLEYLSHRGSQSTDKLYLCWGGHLVENKHTTHAWCELDLSSPQRKGDWQIDAPHAEYNSNDYLFEIPANWAKKYSAGQNLATGRYRDGGWSGQGPTLFALAPWQDGNPPANGRSLAYTTLLRYTSSADQADQVHTMNNYHHSDEWSGAAWLTKGKKGAVVFVGTKGVGDCWYGDHNGPCLDCPGERGWWSTQFEGQIIFYDPKDLADVAAGDKEAWEPQPYAVLKIDQYLYHLQSNQQWYHVGAAAFDRINGLLYVLEPLADDEKPLVHVWKIND